ncbi:hypothetical protein DFH06DRAFT_1147534 [Mycena polygramma]|nr:hypothetical protein DFH06DRAFT_1147534 [Mycena polygramma]
MAIPHGVIFTVVGSRPALNSLVHSHAIIFLAAARRLHEIIALEMPLSSFDRARYCFLYTIIEAKARTTRDSGHLIFVIDTTGRISPEGKPPVVYLWAVSNSRLRNIAGHSEDTDVILIISTAASADVSTDGCDRELGYGDTGGSRDDDVAILIGKAQALCTLPAFYPQFHPAKIPDVDTGISEEGCTALKNAFIALQAMTWFVIGDGLPHPLAIEFWPEIWKWIEFIWMYPSLVIEVFLPGDPGAHSPRYFASAACVHQENLKYYIVPGLLLSRRCLEHDLTLHKFMETQAFLLAICGSGYFFPNPEPELRFRFSSMLNPEPEPAVQVQSGSVQRSGAFERRTEPKFSQSLDPGRKLVLPLETTTYLQGLQTLSKPTRS